MAENPYINRISKQKKQKDPGSADGEYSRRRDREAEEEKQRREEEEDL